MRWHLDIIGFEHCHVFDNESSVDIKSVCDSYGDKVTYELVKGWPNQYALYNRYINNESPAWWVLPIDDDEFLYVGDKYKNNVNMFIFGNAKRHPDWRKICAGWRNMFPGKFTEERTNPHMILNATRWSNEASEIWQAGNRPVKTFVNTVHQYDWADRDKQHRTHNPFVIGKDQPGYTINGEEIWACKQSKATIGTADIILYHYQFKCNREWQMKCASRVSPGAKWFKKNFPELYKRLYDFPNNEDNRVVNLWQKA